jgi:alkylated DNA repair dioxygenase AlkB
MAVAWQGSLFAGAPAPDRSFASCERITLDRGAWLDHAPAWLGGSDALFAELLDTAPWQQRQRHMYDKVLDEPRLTAWWRDGDGGLPPVVLDVRALLSERYGVAFDSVGCNLYRHGRDSVAWHGDTVRKKMAEPLVAIVSLGEPRRFLLRPRGGGRSRRFELGGGDLLVMGGTCQHTWEHTVPKVARAGPRLSVTFRHSEPARTSSAS